MWTNVIFSIIIMSASGRERKEGSIVVMVPKWNANFLFFFFLALFFFVGRLERAGWL